jgi:levanase
MIRKICTRRTALGMIAAAVAAPHFTWAQSGSRNPKFHVSPPFGFINDPQRPLWSNNVWNLWVLWNGDYPTGNGTAWRRYISTDLINWTDQGVSIPKYTNAYGDVWTGSTIVDVNNTAGHGYGAVIALMTMPCDNTNGTNGQNQSNALWYSNDGGVTFSFDSIVLPNYPGNNTAFRDPSVFWHAPSGEWILSLAEAGKLSIYGSSDLKHWSYKSGMLRNDIGQMECPNMFQLHLYNADGATVQDKWVLRCGGDGSSIGFTQGTHYWVGWFDGTTFTPDEWEGQWLDGGPDCYATTVFHDPNASDPLAYAYALSWEDNWDYAQGMPLSGYPGQLSITRQLRLELVNGTAILFNAPIGAQNNVFHSSVQGSNQTISDSVPYHWPSWENSSACRVDFTISPINGSWASAIYFSVRGGDGYFTQVGFEPGAGNAFLKRDTCGPAPVQDSAWNANRNVPCDYAGPVSVNVFVDSGSIEVFLNGGRIAISAQITAPMDATGLNLTTSGGIAYISNLMITS